VTAAKRQAEEIRIREQRLLEESEKLRSQAEADLEIEIAARREDAEREESQRHDAAQAGTRQLVTEAERRAATADEKAAAATAQAEQTRKDAEERARQLVDDAKQQAEQIISKSRVSAEGVYAETKADAERDLARVRGELDELTKQRDSISVYLAQMRQMVGTLLPDSGDDGLRA